MVYEWYHYHLLPLYLFGHIDLSIKIRNEWLRLQINYSGV
ncbi:Uncharacterized protein BM_BM13061 [Brugia malayi]|uniref:Bm13061 n=1 Tax=Brugia malayi TaxID=6279 RepID=A0A0K0IWR2_BRUMA|nr:Uncharacterized protein BM_BM13061 [Brugia malayi]CDP93934.1 Bm13061 [Brugia malayi]VIO97234.1 Uncharacterized protein BM_BM13061 [Brugia malayi]